MSDEQIERVWKTTVYTLLQLRSSDHWPERTRIRVQHYYEADCGILSLLLNRSMADIEHVVDQRAA